MPEKNSRANNAWALTAGVVSTVLVLHEVPNAGEAEALRLWVGARSCPRGNQHSGACRFVLARGGGKNRPVWAIVYPFIELVNDSLFLIKFKMINYF